MARAKTNIDDEQRSYSAVFLVGVGMLVVGAVWAVWDDNVIRRPWKAYQLEFSRLEIDRVKKAIEEENARLEKDPSYQELTRQLAAARQSLESGETAKRLAQLDARRGKAIIRRDEEDLNLRIKKSELEEAWYEYEHAVLSKHSTERPKARIDRLEQEKAQIESRLARAEGELQQIDNEIAETRSAVKSIESKLRELEGPRERLVQKLEGLEKKLFGIELRPIPKIRQVVLNEFDRNHFDQPVARVDRCVSCHPGVDKAGFENDPNPYRTHPQRESLLAKHPPDQFGCTPCHQGQGAAVNSVAKAHGEVKFWEQPLLRGKMVQASCIKCHVDVRRPGAEEIARGEELFVNLGCHGCHLVKGYGDLERVGPYLRRVSAKLDPGWLVRWIENPHQIRPRTKMPNFFPPGSEGEKHRKEHSVALAAYLLEASKADGEQWLAERPLPAGVDPNDAARVAQGRALVDSLGCRGCHGLEEGDSPALLGENKDIAPNLAQIAEKTNPRWIYHWIKNPRGYSPVSRMPSLRLSDEEAAAITSFLASLGAPKPTDPALLAQLRKPEVIASGKALVRKYGCFGCHDIPGMETESRIGVELSTFGSKKHEEIFFGNRTDIQPADWYNWTYHKLKTPRTYETERIEQIMPQFDLADADIKALVTFLYSRSEESVPDEYRPEHLERERALFQGRVVVQKYNCVGCHVIEGKGGAIRARYEETPTLAPPILNGEGAKVQPDWLFGFLKKPVLLRPWLKVRMPTFGLSDEETNALIDYFLAQDSIKVPFVHFDPSAVPPEHIEAARQLVSVDYFNCFSCHQQGDKKPEGPEEGWAPDLTMAPRRLNPEWVIRWLNDPQRIQPGTKMPSFYPGGPEDILGGNEPKQIEALRDYIMSLEGPGQMAGGATGGVARN